MHFELFLRNFMPMIIVHLPNPSFQTNYLIQSLILIKNYQRKCMQKYEVRQSIEKILQLNIQIQEISVIYVRLIDRVFVPSMKLLTLFLLTFFYLQYYITITITITINLIRKICACFIECKVGNKIHPYHNTHQAVFMSIDKFILMQGFSLEQHQFMTEDKASVHLWRIQKQSNQEHKPYPIVILHGLLQSSATWFLTQEKSNSLPYLLAQEGYDVWVADNRGNRISQKDENYHNYTIDHLVQFDQPTIINGVLTATNKKKLIYIGHSQGSTQLLLALGVHPYLQDKIAAFVGLGTVLSFKGLKENRVLNMLSKGYVFQILNWMGFKSLIMLSQRMSRAIGVTISNSKFHLWMVMRGIKELIGLNAEIIPQEMLGIIFTHEPGGGSVNNVLHWVQCFRKRNSFTRFCYGKKINKQKYGSETAPSYCLKHLKALQFNSYFFRGQKDALNSHQDFFNLTSLFSKERVCAYELKEYNHLDYLWGEKVHQDIYEEIVKIVKNSS